MVTTTTTNTMKNVDGDYDDDDDDDADNQHHHHPHILSFMVYDRKWTCLIHHISQSNSFAMHLLMQQTSKHALASYILRSGNFINNAMDLITTTYHARSTAYHLIPTILPDKLHERSHKAAGLTYISPCRIVIIWCIVIILESVEYVS